MTSLDVSTLAGATVRLPGEKIGKVPKALAGVDGLVLEAATDFGQVVAEPVILGGQGR